MPWPASFVSPMLDLFTRGFVLPGGSVILPQHYGNTKLAGVPSTDTATHTLREKIRVVRANGPQPTNPQPRRVRLRGPAENHIRMSVKNK